MKIRNQKKLFNRIVKGVCCRDQKILLARINAAYQNEPDEGEKNRLLHWHKSHRRIVQGEW